MKSIRLVLLALAGCGPIPEGPGPEIARYVRVTPQRNTLECTFTFRPEGGGWTITSVTGALRVMARYDALDQLVDASASLSGGAPAQVRGAAGRATVRVPGRAPEDFEVPPNIIVTSAPDWTDAWRICRRWRREGAGRQEFPGLWIHPSEAPQRLTFSAERHRRDRANNMDLEVLTIHLRSRTEYRAWTDFGGRMIKLVSLPAHSGSTVLVLEGFEAAAASLAIE